MNPRFFSKLLNIVFFTKKGEEEKVNNSTSTQLNDQYSLAKILGIWAVVALPMLLITYVVTPFLIPRVNLLPSFLFWFLTILGMGWQFVVSMWIVYREEGDIRWASIRRARRGLIKNIPH